MDKTKLIERCKEWEGSPYLHMGNNKFGIDCTKLIANIFKDLGFISKVENVRLPRDWMGHTKEEITIKEFGRHIDEYSKKYTYTLGKYVPDDISAGDVVFFRLNPLYPCSHTAIAIDKEKIFHAIDGIGCHFTHFGIYWRRQAEFTMRLVERTES